MELDHVLIAVADLDAAAGELETRFGLVALEGGRHPGWGTANRIVPFGENYLELVTVIDEAEAAASAFGRWIAGARPGTSRPLGWAVRTSELDAVARRLGLDVRDGSRLTADGSTLRWRSAGFEQAVVEPLLPFFIEWGPTTPFPGRSAARHRVGRVAVARLELTGDAGRLAAWLGGADVPAVVRPGAPALAGVVISTPAGELAL